MKPSLSPLGKSAQNIQDFLIQNGIDTQVIEFPAGTRTAQDAATAIGCSIAQIVKSLIFCTQTTNRPILVLASGPNRVNEANVALHVGEPITKADADFARTVTGFAIGGVPPFGHKQTIETFIDQDLLQFHELWAAAGTPHTVFRITPPDLQTITKGKLITVQ